MTDQDYMKLCHFKAVHGALVPLNQRAIDLVEQSVGRQVSLQEKTSRDIKYHRAYFALIGYVYSWMPPHFKSAVTEQNFYKWLKHLMSKYRVLYTFKDGTKMVEYQSISFARMSQAEFQEFVKDQLAVIYEDLVRQICAYPDMVIENIEAEFENFLSNL